ncbi:metallophosphoesterase [Marinococcus sp. PL1-022]|uniref:metallophosphoesterase n=1 Tax=Marinococcus sp. PL1-022 TaxID=3095363 RepID=UPI0029C1CAE5|nr:metallophosphoesterase [Marinococcus sp. PL1-022]MDX6152590.1 metallophosphoesterase [Marinococcus sp. PL1-022]
MIKSKKKMFMLLAAAVLLAISAWGAVEPYTVDVEEEQAVVQNLPQEWAQKEIIAIGDMQIGMWLDNDRNMDNVVDQVIQRSPEAVILLGDYIYHSVGDEQSEMKKAASYLKPLTEAGIPVYAVLGNHDYNMSGKKVKPNIARANHVKNELEQIGVEVLQNRSVALKNEQADEPLYLTGIGAEWPGKSDISKAFNEVKENEARFVVMHNPETFNEVPRGKASAAVAGHTHGGQIRIPFTPHWSWKNLLPEDEAHVDGWAGEEYGNKENNLYINRGLGVSLAPIRINNPPEITEFQLTSQKR